MVAGEWAHAAESSAGGKLPRLAVLDDSHDDSAIGDGAREDARARLLAALGVPPEAASRDRLWHMLSAAVNDARAEVGGAGGEPALLRAVQAQLAQRISLMQGDELLLAFFLIYTQGGRARVQDCMSREFAAEGMLFLVEADRLRRFCCHHAAAGAGAAPAGASVSSTAPAAAPSADDALEGRRWLALAGRFALSLYKRFVARDAEACVNVSAAQQAAILRALKAGFPLLFAGAGRGSSVLGGVGTGSGAGSRFGSGGMAGLRAAAAARPEGERSPAAPRAPALPAPPLQRTRSAAAGLQLGAAPPDALADADVLAAAAGPADIFAALEREVFQMLRFGPLARFMVSEAMARFALDAVRADSVGAAADAA